MLPFLKGLYDKDKKREKFPGLLENIYLKSVPSNSKNFKDIILIDTPGLADGDLKYKFNIENALEWFANRCDMVLIFFDPNGQALCKRTTSLVCKLHYTNSSKLSFYMTKGDVFETDEDRFKCMC
jgi:GTP1/Obg family GTP-binding protein